MENEDVEQILLTYCWGNSNPGDKVITKGSILALRKIFPEAKIKVWHISPHEDSTFQESKRYLKNADPNIDLIPNPIDSWEKNNIPFIGIDSLKSRVLPLLASNISPKFLNDKRGFSELVNSDLVIFNSGHLFYWNPRMAYIRKRVIDSYPLWLAKKLDIPYGILPHSFGPFEFRWYQSLVHSYYKNLFFNADFIFTRDGLSKKYLKNEFGNNLEIINSIDTGFFVNQKKGASKEILKKYNLKEDQFITLTLRLSTRGRGKLEEKKYSGYGEKLSSSIEKIINKYDYKIAVVCQVPSDKIHSKYILNRLPDNLQNNCEIIGEKLEPETLQSLYEKSKLLIGMRFHSLIFALNVGTPVIGIYYYDIGPKICGLLNDFGWPNLEFDLEKMEVDSLIEQVDYVLDNNAELQVKEKVNKRKKEFLSYLEEIRENLIEE